MKNITIEIPKNIIKDSVYIEASAVGDLLGSTIFNLGHLIRQPIGTSEQTLVNLMPDIIILDYLQNTGQATPAILSQAVKRLETTYQELLAYKQKDGSFSAFDHREEQGNVWLTSYTLLALSQANKYIYIDSNIITKGLEWLVNRQAANGSFIETGTIIHQELQNKKNSLALTAFVSIALLEISGKGQSKFTVDKYIINKALDYIARNLLEEEDPLTLAISAYSLQLAQHPYKLNAVNLLDSKAQYKEGIKFWEKPMSEKEKKNPWNALPKSIDITSTSYGLLALLEANYFEDAMPILNWLVSQQSSLGSFTSSFDTVVGLQALYKVGLRLTSSPSIRINFSTKPKESRMLSINKDSAMIVQKFQVFFVFFLCNKKIIF